MINFTGDIGWPICRDSDGGGSGGGSDSGGKSGKDGKEGKGTSAAEGYGQAAASMAAAGIGSVGGRSASSDSSGRSSGRAGAVGQDGVGGGFSGSGKGASSSGGKSSSGGGPGGRAGAVGTVGAGGGFAPAEAAPTSGGRAGAVGTPGVSGGFFGAAGLDGRAESGGRAGGVGKSGVGGGFSAPATSAKDGYSLAAQTMNEVGIGSVGGRAVERSDMSRASQARAAENQSMKTYDTIQSFLSTLRSVEAQKTDPYNGLVAGKKGYDTPTHVPLTDMTIGQVMAYQAGMPSRGHKSKAVGAYQMIDTTLAEAVARTGVSKDAKFTKSMQDYLAMDLAQNRAAQATVNGKVDPGKFATKLAQEWAALPTVAGKTFYDDGVNKSSASLSRAAVVAIAQSLIDTKAVQPGRGFTSAMKSDNPGSTASKTAPPTGFSLPGVAPTPTSRPAYSSLPDTAPTPTSRISQFADPPDEGRFAARYLSALPDTAPTPTSRISQFADPPDEGRFAARTVSPATVEDNTKAAHQQLAATIGTTNVMGLDGKTAPYGTMTGVHTAAPGQTAVQSGALNESNRSMSAAADVASRASRVGTALAPVPSRELSAIKAGYFTDEAPAATDEEATTVPTREDEPTEFDDAKPDDGKPGKTGKIGRQIGATVLDVLLGLIPGLNIAATVANTGLTIAGRPTIGKMAADALIDNKWGSKGILSASGVDTGDGGWAIDLSADTEEAKPTEETGDEFGWKYLGWRDETKRPKPRDRWYRNRDSYARREYS